MVDLGGLGRKAGEFLKSEKAQKALNSEKAERISDGLLQKGGDLASKLTKGKYDDRIDALKRQADRSVGTDGATGGDGSTGTDGTPRPDRGAGEHGAGPATPRP